MLWGINIIYSNENMSEIWKSMYKLSLYIIKWLWNKQGIEFVVFVFTFCQINNKWDMWVKGKNGVSVLGKTTQLLLYGQCCVIIKILLSPCSFLLMMFDVCCWIIFGFLSSYIIINYSPFTFSPTWIITHMWQPKAVLIQYIILLCTNSRYRDFEYK